uniref:Uncharacterized protein n=1 Tax=Anguilla anguilla TaxID=7936 RepID=A0A0E9UEM7_ANGAN
MVYLHVVCVGTVHLGLQQHPESGHLLSLQPIQTGPDVVTHQVQLFTETTILDIFGIGDCSFSLK